MEGLANVLSWTGYYYQLVGQYDKALKYYEEALAIIKD
jgi:tetratricopeptide (TPR) repeat protein